MKANTLHSFRLLAAALVVPALSLTGYAQTPTPTPTPKPSGSNGDHRPPGPPPSSLVISLDVNHDHVITADEIANAAKALAVLDKNKDGQLVPDELRPSTPPKQTNGMRPPAPPMNTGTNSGIKGKSGTNTLPPPPKDPLMEALDVNHDGVLAATEIAAAPQSLLTLDKNGDGELTPDEFAPPKPTPSPTPTPSS
jgi:hypothetical protein